MPLSSKVFYLFTAFHSFLLGLLPLFIPVILWDKGLSISQISYFIVLTAVGFLIALHFWDRLRSHRSWQQIIYLSFLFQALLVGLLLWDEQYLIISIGAMINGVAGCFYWSTQRFLFQAITQDKNTGNTFGNFQIVVVFSLKIGILVGSYLLGMQYFIILLVLSLAFSLLGLYLLNHSLSKDNALYALKQLPAFTLKQILQFKDEHKSKRIFAVDGLFLFLESYFWVLTLYMLTQQSIMQLGLVIVVLSLLLALIFFIIKKHIDHIKPQKIYIIAVIGYAFSWILRGEMNEAMSAQVLYSGLLLIAFLSSFFRLAFNKRFYDIARSKEAIFYIICKSYYSQFMLICFFSAIAILANFGDNPLRQLQILYALSVPLTLFYFSYGSLSVKQSVRS